MNQIAPRPAYRDVAIANHGGGGKLMPQTFGDVVAFSEIMARAQHAIPKHLRDVPGACLAVTMQAMRWEMDPFAVASKSYNVKDLIAYEAQLIAAVVHTRAPIKTRPEYSYAGEGQDRRCTVSATFDDGVKRSYESPRIGDITVKNSPLWKSDPDQQLGYFSIRSFARRYCPEVILGVYTPEEAEQFRGPDNARDVTPSLSDRLAAAKAADGTVEGFSVQHVINEIAAYPEGASGTAREAPSAGSGDDALQASSGTQSAPPSHSSAASATSPPAAAQTDTPAFGTDSPALSDAGTLSAESSADLTTRADEEGEGDGGAQQGVSAAVPSLPDGWGIVYASALRRAQKPENLPKLAKQFWDAQGGWDKHKAGPHAETAAAIFNCFKNHFGNKDAIEAELRELI